ncbi:CPBP family intramembrane glutamic endopeptidase [Brevibacterium sp. GP-SGM9]|uniref:CPBP family intramembrane glutamic endopeptidase n=1 Tax=Brevibacterium sp. GP-SGM9 TaxID=3376990 RepID=UPI0039A69DEF
MLLTVIVIVGTYLFQTVLLSAAAMVEVGVFDKDPNDPSLTPLTYLALNASIILIAPLAVLALRALTGARWSAVMALGRRFSMRRLFAYAGVFAILMIALNIVVNAVHPASADGFAVTGATVALLVIIVITTPLQSAAEEITFRGVLMTSYGSWARSAKLAMVIGVSLSSVLFATLHTSADPWMIVNYLGLGASTAIIAVISRGLEASIAYHAMNNVFAMAIGSLFASGGGIAQDRSAGAAGPYMLLFVLAEAVAIVIVWQVEKRRTARARGVNPEADAARSAA